MCRPEGLLDVLSGRLQHGPAHVHHTRVDGLDDRQESQTARPAFAEIVHGHAVPTDDESDAGLNKSSPDLKEDSFLEVDLLFSALLDPLQEGLYGSAVVSAADRGLPVIRRRAGLRHVRVRAVGDGRKAGRGRKLVPYVSRQLFNLKKKRSHDL